MKTNKILIFITLISLTFAILSCVQDDDFTIPNSLGFEENEKLNLILSEIEAGTTTLLSIQEVKRLYQNETPAYIETNIAIKGYVSSSDQSGNFFKELFIQDAQENPTSGIKIILNQVEIYNQYNFGREVYIKLKGLYVGEERVGTQVIAIGGTTSTDRFGTTVERLTENQRASSIYRSENTFDIIPKQLNIAQVTSKDVGLYVQFSNVEFTENLNGLRYFDPIQDFDTPRTLQSCGVSIGYSNFILETSSFASFKEVLLPTGNGTVAGVITKTFDGSSLVLALNDVKDVKMEGPRCTPLTIDAFSVIYSEDFQASQQNAIFNLPGWTNFSQAGTSKWREKFIDGNGFSEFSSFGSSSASNIGWLITPSFNMDTQENEYLNFKTAQHHLDSPLNSLEVYVSSDFDGTNVLSATWELLSPALASQNNTWYQFIDSGLIDLSSYTGKIHIAFKVTGSGTNLSLDGAYQLDNLKILAKE